MLRSNFVAALYLAIKKSEQYDSESALKGNSCFTDGLKEVVRSAENGEDIQIK